jgi:hypothetical protein
VEDPSPELINEYHEQYMRSLLPPSLPPSLLPPHCHRETKNLFDKYKNAYGWQQKTLSLKK